MTSQDKNDKKLSGTSLLLQPPRSGFSWSDSSGSVLLMPASPESLSETDHPSSSDKNISAVHSFEVVGEKTKQETFPYSTAFAPAVISSSFSQLNQPLGGRWYPSSSLESSLESAPVTSNKMPNQSPTVPVASSSFMSNYQPNTSSYFSGGVSSISSTALTSSTAIGDAINSQFNGQYSASHLEQMPSPVIDCHASHSLEPKGMDGCVYPNSVNTSSYIGGISSGLQLFYTPVEPHWFYKKTIEKRDVWFPFSVLDSLNLEDGYKKDQVNTIIATDGGRYDVYVSERLKKAVYWKEENLLVRRCTWFYKSDGPLRFTPYDEDFSATLEDLYRNCSVTGKWGQRLEMSGSEVIVLQSPQVILHYLLCSQTDDWVPTSDGKLTQRVLKRGVDEMIHVEDGESVKIDHLVFVVQGIGAVCDLRFRTVAECVDGFRDISNALMKTHFKHAVDAGHVGRVEFLPVSWHGSLHTDETGVDRQMQTITLPSIPKLRHFTNDTLLDILYYTSPIYCQTILDSVGDQLNSIYQLFVSRNPDFLGKISVAGHSLGSLILFDMLAHQTQVEIEMHNEGSEFSADVETEVINNTNYSTESIQQSSIHNDYVGNDTLEILFENLGLQEYFSAFVEEKIDVQVLGTLDEDDFQKLGLPMGPRKKLLAYLKHREIKHKTNVIKIQTAVENAPEAAQPIPSVIMGDVNDSPSTSVFCTQSMTADYPVSLKKNVFVPIKYPRLIFSPSCFFALGSPIAMFLTVRGFNSISDEYQFPTCPSFFNIFHPFDPVAFRIETLIDQNFTAKPVVIPHHKGRKRLHIELREGLTRMGSDLKQKLLESLRYTWNSISEFAKAHSFPTATVEAEVEKIVQQQMDNAYEEDSTVSASDACRDEDVQIGQLNGGRRIDYVLQEKPIESLNEYLFALTSHATYWDSEDTVLMILKEAYSLENIFPSAPSPESGKIQLYNPAVVTSLASGTVVPQTFSTPGNQSMMISAHPPPNESQKFMGISSTESALPSVSKVLSPNVPNLPASPKMSLGSPTQTSSNIGQPIGPPPLTGFVKRSALNKH